jgi:hypothetical protein
MAKAEFNKKTLFTGKLYSNLKKKLVNCYNLEQSSVGAGT